MKWNDFNNREIVVPRLEGETTIECPNCGENIFMSNVVLTTYPPQFGYFCKSCGWAGTSFVKWESANNSHKNYRRGIGGRRVMRLIDADALIPNEVHTIIRLTATGEQMESVVYAEQIDNAPTIDAVPVVRCKDCIWYGKYGFCRYNDIYVERMDWFCADGERKDDV